MGHFGRIEELGCGVKKNFGFLGFFGLSFHLGVRMMLRLGYEKLRKGLGSFGR